MNTFTLLIEYVINSGLDKIITRQTLIAKFVSKNTTQQTIDTYRRLLSKAGCLKTIEPGLYKIVKLPCRTMTTHSLKKKYKLK